MKLESFNDTHREKLCFTQFGTRIYQNRSLAASDLFHIFIQSFKLYTLLHCRMLKSDSHLPKNFVLLAPMIPLTMMKIPFHFILKALFVLKIFKFFSWMFGHLETTA